MNDRTDTLPPPAKPEQPPHPKEELGLLLAEMTGLSLLLLGVDHPHRSDAEIEAQFDNMPV